MFDPLAATLRRWRWRFVIARFADAAWWAVAAAAIAGVVSVAFALPPAWPGSIAAIVTALLTWRGVPTLACVAAYADRQHDLSDLLGTAWATRHRQAEPWAVALTNLAAARVVALPPPKGVARVTGRRHACLAATIVAGWLAAGLVERPGSQNGNAAAPAMAAEESGATPRTQVAAARRRSAETADEAGRIPAAAEPESIDAPGRSARPATGDRPANGPGRADAVGSPIRSPTPGVQSVKSTAAGESGSGRESSPADQATKVAASEVVAGTAAADRTDAVFRQSTPIAPPHSLDKTEVPAVTHRDMIRDYFSR